MNRSTLATRFARAAACALLAVPVAGCGLVGSDEAGASGGAEPTFTVAAGGDILLHTQLVEQAHQDAGGQGYDFSEIMAGIEPVISEADLGICHLEPVLGEPSGPFQAYPDFLVPPQIATTIKDIGYDTCSTASNHTLDHGPEGVHRTLDVLDEAGVRHTGSARDQEEADTPLVMDVNGVQVAQLSFAFGFNGREVPEDQPWLANETSFDAIAAAEEAARAAGAEVVLLSMHWGRAHQPGPSRSQLKLGRRIAQDTGIDLVIGHHAHVVQPMEKVDGTWIAYGLGNQLARHDVPTGLTEEGAIGWFEFTRAGDGWAVEARYVPTLVDIPPDPEAGAAGLVGDEAAELPPGPTDHRLVDVVDQLADGEGLTAEQRARYLLAYERTLGTMLNRGAARDGLGPLKELPAG
ncbi:CapA family protein [Streptomyces sp. TRM70308]|uniref:CapA family protein n=1 Tax=Streptomyces sp. TRM70308 TaxID=3131932 RepID=UPI003CFDE513